MSASESIFNFNKLKQSDILVRYNHWKESIDKGATIEEIKKAVGQVIGWCPLFPINVTNFNFYRARKNFENYLFDNVSQLMNPPPEVITKMGRANREGKSMLYVAQHLRTALFETRLNKGDYVTVAQITLKENSKLKLFHFNSLEKLGISNWKEIGEVEKKGLKIYNAQGRANAYLVKKLIKTEFLRTDDEVPEKAYTLSNSVAEILLNNERIHGLMYPSLLVGGDSNLVLKEGVAKNVYIKKCFLFFVVAVGSKNYTTKLMATSKEIEADGNIIWKAESSL